MRKRYTVDLLSKLLKKGKKGLKKQVKGSVFEIDDNGDLCGCAIGAIAVGAGYNPVDSRGNLKSEAIETGYKIVRDVIQACGYTKTEIDAESCIYSMNDTYDMSFAEIAKKLKEVEKENKIKTCNKS